MQLTLWGFQGLKSKIVEYFSETIAVFQKAFKKSVSEVFNYIAERKRFITNFKKNNV